MSDKECFARTTAASSVMVVAATPAIRVERPIDYEAKADWMQCPRDVDQGAWSIYSIPRRAYSSWNTSVQRYISPSYLLLVDYFDEDGRN